ncbi:MAG: hydrogenase maturation nickel metallochaperone HypA [Methanomassiliicoccales archaeon]|nr:MAG: hydrogenase maturation nickel metallochaperone HypA [Methanomassiliicoccales archaeon]
MHEVSVMASILEGVRKELESHEYDKVEELVLVVGELTYLGREQLEFAYEVLTRGTDLEGSLLVINDEPVEVKCGSCGYSGPVEHLSDDSFHVSVPKLSCPRCGSNVEVLKGKSCRVTSVKVVSD